MQIMAQIKKLKIQMNWSKRAIIETIIDIQENYAKYEKIFANALVFPFRK